MRYLTVGDVLSINRRLYGEDNPFDFGLLESAVHQPQVSAGLVDAYPDIHSKAAALFRSLVRNHPFHIRGNKTTAVYAVVLFYGLNGFDLIMEDGEFYGFALDVAEGLLDVADIANKFKPNVTAFPIPDEEDDSL